MKIAVAGLWHLGCVTCACCARHFQVVGWDSDTEVVAGLFNGKAPVFEPGLDELLTQGTVSGQLQFTADPQSACAGAAVLWVTFDTPVNDDDEADVEFVLARIRSCVPFLPSGSVVLISSQLPVGTCRRLEEEFPGVAFAYSPENLQLGKALAAFEQPARIIVGLRDDSKQSILSELLSPFSGQIVWMRTESAEMVKHGLNSFLALSITFINELAALCEQTGADAKEVAGGLKSDMRIGPKAYLSPGGAFAGGTLARDVVSLMHAGEKNNVRLDVISSIKRSNDWHRGWALRRLQHELGDLPGRQIALLGLTYKPGTNTLRRSSAIELAQSLSELGAAVRAFDPAIATLPQPYIEVTSSAADAVKDCDALVVCTEWPQFRKLPWSELLPSMKQPLILDANRFLDKELMAPDIEYLSVGRA